MSAKKRNKYFGLCWKEKRLITSVPLTLRKTQKILPLLLKGRASKILSLLSEALRLAESPNRHNDPHSTHTLTHTHMYVRAHTHTLTPTLRSLTAQANCCTKMGLPSTKRVISPTGVSSISPLRCWEVAASNRGNSWAENRQLEKTQSFPCHCWHVQEGTSARNRFCILLSPCSFLRITAVKLIAK